LAFPTTFDLVDRLILATLFSLNKSLFSSARRARFANDSVALIRFYRHLYRRCLLISSFARACRLIRLASEVKASVVTGVIDVTGVGADPNATN